MGINSYNNETEQTKLINDLKSLPKINTPENFELNLMTRIQNQNFGESKEEKAQFNFIKFLAPSAVVVSAIIVFFLFFSDAKQIDNPLMTEPPAIISDSQGNISSSKTDLAVNKIQTTKEKSGSVPGVSESATKNSAADTRIRKNDAVSESKTKYPISRNRSVSLDEFISGDAQKGTNIQRGNVVNNGEEASEFDGFFVRQQPDKETISKYRALIDSVKKAQLKTDSIKNARK